MAARCTIFPTPKMTAAPESVARLRDAIEAGFADGASSDVEVRYATPEGERITQCRLVPERDGAGVVVDMLLKSWRVYESYTGPLGAGSLTDIGASQAASSPSCEPKKRTCTRPLTASLWIIA